ncbi:transglycosylase SLT domain-containing protein [Methyloprofundus sp.]|uniref:transglycosylase SLT domain-containing protein n=1 Tax=Methyloprofundus sp. TaxID=2020875 RepID=UPI003D0B8228
MRNRVYQLLVLLLLVGSFPSFAGVLEQQRIDFVQAEHMIATGDERGYAAISAGLESYPLYFYLQYQWLSKHLSQDQKILNFLNNGKQSLYTRKLRRKWLAYLYKRGRWDTFVAHYKSSKRKSMQCRYNWAEYQRNHKTQALTATQKIWLTGSSLPKDCDLLLKKFTQSEFLTQTLIWQRFLLAAKARQYKLATYLSKKLESASARSKADKWLKLVKNPKLIEQAGFLQGLAKTQQADMFTYAMKKMVSADVDNAVQFWDTQGESYVLSAAQTHNIERAIALQLAFNKSAKAYSRFNLLTSLDGTTRLWAVRAALIEHNWEHVNQALQNLSVSEKRQERWRYWQAKALLETNQRDKGLAIFKQLAEERSYYGFLAADYLQQEYALVNKPIKINAQLQSRLLAKEKFSIVREFRELEMQKEAQQFWWEAVRNLQGDELLNAAKIAQQWHWHRLAILTVARAKHWDDVELRFPIDYAEKIQQNAQIHQLDTSIIYALIRRESMFDPKAGSPVGAMGLMQIMPGTGKQIAKEMNYPWRSKMVLLQPSLNLKFGAYYYKQMLDKFDGHFALAAAAYNAGPHNVTKWLRIDRDYAADIWIETIPYKETRAYVAAVLTYALIYQNRIQSGDVRMRDFMRDIRASNGLAAL